MPANLPPQYYTVEKKLREAKAPREKIAVIEELLTIIPKHKGTERLRGDFIQKLTFARIWGKNTYPGQKVSKDYFLADKDVIELHV